MDAAPPQGAVKGNHRFTDLRRGLPRISKNLLTQRLVAFERAGILERRPAQSGHGHEYFLTRSGEELAPVIDALGTWAYKWVSRELTPENLDPGLLMWFLRRRVRVENLPPERVVVRFAFRDSRRRFWLVLDRPEVDLCYSDPGFGVDLEVNADLEAMTRVYLAHTPLASAMRDGLLQIGGPFRLRRAFPSWIGVTPFAEHAPRRAA